MAGRVRAALCNAVQLEDLVSELRRDNATLQQQVSHQETIIRQQHQDMYAVLAFLMSAGVEVWVW